MAQCMTFNEVLILAVAFFGIAVLYTTVGHAGASGYLAAMALIGIAPVTMRPTALVLNILVACLTVYRFRRARMTSWSGLWPFLAGSVPFAALGGAIVLPKGGYYAALAVVMLLSASVLLWRAYGRGGMQQEGEIRVKRIAAMCIGAIIGLLSGLTGTGGGIFLSPTILLLGWAGPKTTAGISAPFILVNSVVALAAGSFAVQALPDALPVLAASALAGAVIGTWLGLQRLNARALLTTLAMVMSLAAAKLLITA